jgi:hypothetical protein
MDIGAPLKELGEYDIAPLTEAILSVSADTWKGNTFRQLEYEVHEQTQSIVMLFTRLA